MILPLFIVNNGVNGGVYHLCSTCSARVTRLAGQGVLVTRLASWLLDGPMACCEPSVGGCSAARCSGISLYAGYSDPAASCLTAYDEEDGRPCVWTNLVCSAAISCPPPPAARPQDRGRLPHVVLIMTDQQSVWTISGYHESLSASPRSYASASDAASGAAPPLHTPHLDRLMARGVAFTSFVASAPWCVPSRGCL